MQIEKTAKTINMAIDEALKELNTTIDKIEYTVLQQPTKGFLGFGSKPAKILVKLQEQQEEYIIQQNDIIENSKSSVENKTSIEEENQLYKKPPNKDAEKIAEEFLSNIFKKMNISIDIDTSRDDKNHLLINLKGEDLGIIIGKRGQTLDSLQYLTNLIVNKGQYAFVSVTLDTEDYRERRKKTLENLAINLAIKAKKTGTNISLEPMNPYERRIIHGALHQDKTIKTYSEGKEPFRYVVISPNNKEK